jgi:hypothetical protein
LYWSWHPSSVLPVLPVLRVLPLGRTRFCGNTATQRVKDFRDGESVGGSMVAPWEHLSQKKFFLVL